MSGEDGSSGDALAGGIKPVWRGQDEPEPCPKMLNWSKNC